MTYSYSYKCPICEECPGSHSLSKIHVKRDGTAVFYTCPAKSSKFWDRPGIEAHYEGMLSELGDTPWIWIVDFSDFSLVHTTVPGVVISVARIVQKYSKNLRKIRVINNTWYLDMILNLTRPFMSPESYNLIQID